MGSSEPPIMTPSKIGTGLILPPVLNEFADAKRPFLKLGQNIGLLVGAAFWGVGADIWGRRCDFSIVWLSGRENRRH